MSIKAVLFDLDGTLLPMDQDIFIKEYFKNLSMKLAPLGYEPEKLIKAVWAGTEAMIKNNGINSNEYVFWDDFCKICGEKAKNDITIFENFYKNEFQRVKSVCGVNPKAKDIVYNLKNNGIIVALATNPIFPSIATESRIRWAGLEPSDFKLYTTYENISYSKPNLKYYSEIINKLGLKPEECVMVGNDVSDDMVAQNIGINVFLLTDNLINKDNVDISKYQNGNFDDLSNYLTNII